MLMLEDKTDMFILFLYFGTILAFLTILIPSKNVFAALITFFVTSYALITYYSIKTGSENDE